MENEYENLFNTQIKNFLQSTKNKIIISKNKSNINFNIKLQNKSLIKIFDKINDKDFYIQDFLKLSMISEIRDTISLESKEIFDKCINLLNNCKLFYIILKRKSICKIKISKTSLKLLFKYLGIEFGEEVFNYLEIMIYQEITTYHFDEYENIDELLFNIYNNNFGKNNFYIYNNKNNDLSPISNYSIKTILNMLNKSDKENVDHKYFVFKIKDKNILLLEEMNKNLLDKLLLENDYKFLYNKYNSNGGLVNDWKYIEQNNIILRQKKSDLIEFDNYLLSAEELLRNVMSKMEQYKKDFNKKISNDNNIFIQIKDMNNNIKYINIQYIKLINRKYTYYNDKYSSFTLEYDIPDYLGENISLSLNKEEINNYLLQPESSKFISILNNDKKYLIKVEFLKNLLNNWKSFGEKYIFDIEYPLKEEKELSLNEITIDEQNKIKNIICKVNNGNKNDKSNNNNFKKVDYLFLKEKNEEKDGKCSSGNLGINYHLSSDFNGRKYSELLNSETNDSNDSEFKMNKSMYLINNYNILPEKDFYAIHKVVKIIKKDKKRKGKKEKKNK